jgi:hypothetical protein
VAYSVAHRWFGRLGASLVYLRDFRRLFFQDGIPGLGNGREAALVQLRSIIGGLGADRVLCYGFSSGGFAALQYGLELSAENVLAIAGAYNLSPDFAVSRDMRSDAYRNHPISRRPVDLRGMVSRAANPPRALLLFADGYPIDRIQAEHMAGARNVQLRVVPECRTHLLVAELIKRGTFDATLRWLVEGGDQLRS